MFEIKKKKKKERLKFINHHGKRNLPPRPVDAFFVSRFERLTSTLDTLRRDQICLPPV